MGIGQVDCFSVANASAFAVQSPRTTDHYLRAMAACYVMAVGRMVARLFKSFVVLTAQRWFQSSYFCNLCADPLLLPFDGITEVGEVVELV